MCFRNRQTNRKICERNIQRGLICALETDRQTERLWTKFIKRFNMCFRNRQTNRKIVN
jgi:hypothetical protein